MGCGVKASPRVPAAHRGDSPLAQDLGVTGNHWNVGRAVSGVKEPESSEGEREILVPLMPECFRVVPQTTSLPLL